MKRLTGRAASSEYEDQSELKYPSGQLAFDVSRSALGVNITDIASTFSGLKSAWTRLFLVPLIRLETPGVSTSPAAARTPVKGAANCFVGCGVHRSAAKTLDGAAAEAMAARDVKHFTVCISQRPDAAPVRSCSGVPLHY